MTNPTPKAIIEGLEECLSETKPDQTLAALSPRTHQRQIDRSAQIQAAIDYIKATMWVPIDEIPEEWKDGRYFDVLHNRGRDSPNKRVYSEALTMKHNGNYFEGQLFVGACSVTGSYVTHAMLPIPLSALGEPE